MFLFPPLLHLLGVPKATAAKLVLMCVCLSSLGAADNLSGVYTATAYSQSGITASGVVTARHIVAADPDVLPIGSRIKIKHAGRYSGEYVVADTGRKIEGRRLDIYMPNTEKCLKFGKKQVKVRVIKVGDGTKATTTQAQQEVKQDVQKDLANKAVGNAATEDDWARKKAASTPSNPATTASGAAAPSSPATTPSPAK